MYEAFRKRYGFAFAVWISPWLLLAITACSNDKFIGTMFLNKTGLLLMAGVFIWETIGCFLLTKGLPAPQPLTQRKGFYVNVSPKVVLVVIVFVLPAYLLTLLGPMLVTLLEAGVLSPR